MKKKTKSTLVPKKGATTRSVKSGVRSGVTYSLKKKKN